MKTAIWWIEHIAKTKGTDLIRPTTQNIPWFIYYSFDVYGILIVILLIFLTMFVLISKFIYKFIFISADDKKLKIN